MYTWSERCRLHARIFLCSGESVNERWSMIKYWSNSDGDLHRYGKEAITEDQLPFILKRHTVKPKIRLTVFGTLSRHPLFMRLRYFSF